MIYQLSPKIVLLFRAHFFITSAIKSASSLHDLLIANHQHAAFHLLCMLTRADGLFTVVFFSFLCCIRIHVSLEGQSFSSL